MAHNNQDGDSKLFMRDMTVVSSNTTTPVSSMNKTSTADDKKNISDNKNSDQTSHSGVNKEKNETDNSNDEKKNKSEKFPKATGLDFDDDNNDIESDGNNEVRWTTSEKIILEKRVIKVLDNLEIFLEKIRPFGENLSINSIKVKKINFIKSLIFNLKSNCTVKIFSIEKIIDYLDSVKELYKLIENTVYGNITNRFDKKGFESLERKMIDKIEEDLKSLNTSTIHFFEQLFE